jgi:hypothetical protein
MDKMGGYRKKTIMNGLQFTSMINLKTKHRHPEQEIAAPAGVHDPYTFTEILVKGWMVMEPEICRHFGCGKWLNSFERLCGNYCVNHQKKGESKCRR